MLKHSLSILCCAFILSLFSITADARTNINLGVTIAASPPPPSNVVMMPPQGYNNCYMTQGAWYGNVWIPPHQECTYADPSGPSLWVSGYWGCLAVGPGGGCGRWHWYSGRWARGPQVGYYSNHYQGRPYYGHRRW